MAASIRLVRGLTAETRRSSGGMMSDGDVGAVEGGVDGGRGTDLALGSGMVNFTWSISFVSSGGIK